MKAICGLALVLTMAVPAAAGELQAAPVPKPVELIPRAAGIARDHPRLLLRAKDSPPAVSVEQLRKIPRDAEFNAMLEGLRKCGGAAEAKAEATADGVTLTVAGRKFLFAAAAPCAVAEAK